MKEEDIYELFQNINSKEDFLRFLQLLKNDFNINKSKWENENLYSYLDAMERYFSDIVNKDKLPTWKLFAEILLASKVYE